MLPCKIPADMDVWVVGSPVHSSHSLWWYKGLFMCITCGAMGSSKLRKLTLPCPLVPIVSGPKAIARFKQGLLPWGLTHWPDQTLFGAGKTVASL